MAAGARVDHKNPTRQVGMGRGRALVHKRLRPAETDEHHNSMVVEVGKSVVHNLNRLEPHLANYIHILYISLTQVSLLNRRRKQRATF